jgi:hypothetical protein
MRLADAVAAVYRSFDPDAALADVAGVARHDRYQASTGIAEAAAFVADRAEAAGLSDVTVHAFPADGAQRWWTYRAPLAWTPRRARLRLAGGPIVRYPEQPYTLAAYSAATAPGGRSVPVLRWSAVLGGTSPAGALVALDDPQAAFPEVAGRLAAAGAVALVADPLAGRPDRSPDQVGRLELPPGSALVAFSLTEALLARVTAAADAGCTATVEVDLDGRIATMPVVTGVLPGRPGPEEILLTAHLCHPRPSANDNASGVAALLGAARVLRAWPAAGLGASVAQPGVRFVWGPEFVGLAAYLHDIVQLGGGARPVLAINVDMAGEDPRRCGGPLVIERGPDHLPSFLPALAERCAALLPAAGRSYSGAVPSEPWSWRSAPFAGGSDHALLVDAPTRCPTVSFGHWPDRTNHTSADTLDTVDAAELRRTAAVATAAVVAVRGRADPQLAADVADATAAWAAGYVLDALPGRRATAPPVAATDGGSVLDPRDCAQTARVVAHRGAVAVGAVRTLGVAGVPASRMAELARWVSAMIGTVGRAAGPAPEPAAGRSDRAVLDGRWPGPVNLRALAEAAEPPDRGWLNGRLAADRGGTFARTLAVLHAIDGRRDRRAVAWWAALSTDLPVPVAFADRVLDLLCAAGWAVPAARERGTTGAPADPA